MTPEPAPTNGTIGSGAAAAGELFVAYAFPLRVAKIQLDGSHISPDLELDATPARPPAIVKNGDGVVVVWTQLEGQQEQLALARVGSDLQIVGGPTPIPETAGVATSVAAVVPTGDGITLLFGVTAGGQTELRFIRLDPDGNAVSEPVTVASLAESYTASASAIATADGGYVVVYSADDVVYFVMLDADGTARYGPGRISAPAKDARSYIDIPQRNVLMQFGDSYYATFTEDRLDYGNATGFRRVRIAKIDEAGLITLYGVQTELDGIASEQPTFARIDDRIGLAWSEAPVEWYCRDSCVSQAYVHFALIDPNGMVPASDIVTHDPPLGHGIKAPMLLSNGPDLLTVGNLDFHAFTEPATGAIRCVPLD